MSTMIRSFASALLLALFIAQPIAFAQPERSGTSTPPKINVAPPQVAAMPAPPPHAPPTQVDRLDVGQYEGYMKTWSTGVVITSVDRNGVPIGTFRGSLHYLVGQSEPTPAAAFDAGIGLDGRPFIKFPSPSRSTATGVHMGGPDGKHLCGLFNHVDNGRGNRGMDSKAPFCLGRM